MIKERCGIAIIHSSKAELSKCDDKRLAGDS